ncbi:MAG TPA: OmpH family outer membrane protein [bacterium]|nr:OmpH family outer membrane protein [bacterium]
MRKLMLAVIVGLIVTLTAGPALAGKVGFVDLQKVLELTKMGKDINQKMATRTDELKIKVKKAELKVITLRDEVQKTASALSDEAKREKYEELNKLMGEYQQVYQQSAMEVEQYKLELFKALIAQIKTITAKIASSEGYDIVLLKVDDVMTEGGVVLYGSSSVDLTDKVIRQMNAQ